MQRESLTTITTKIACKKLNMSQEALQRALIQGCLPFGFAIENKDNKYRPYSYIIFQELMEMFIDGKLPCICNECIRSYL